MLAVGRIGRGIELRVFFIRGDRFMRLVETDIKEEWLHRVAVRAEPLERLIGDKMRRIALQLADRLTIADKVIRIAVARGRVVLRREPLVEAVVAWRRLRRRVV